MNKLFHAVIYCAFHAILPTFISDCRLSQQEILLRSQDALCQTEAKTCYKKLNKYFFFLLQEYIQTWDVFLSFYLWCSSFSLASWMKGLYFNVRNQLKFIVKRTHQSRQILFNVLFLLIRISKLKAKDRQNTKSENLIHCQRILDSKDKGFCLKIKKSLICISFAVKHGVVVAWN